MNSEIEKSNAEPHLKYLRMANDAKEIISKDSISCIAVHHKFIVIGTEWGNIYILDHMGYPSSKRALNAHSIRINQISIDAHGEFIASCSNDGKVRIFGLLDDKSYPVLSFNQAIKAIAISPDFKRTSQFVTGDTRLLLVSKSILSNHKHKVLQENATLIRNIKWNNNIVIYATENLFFVFDMRESKLIGIIEPDKTDLSTDVSEFYCRIYWINHNTFMIGWGHMVEICIIKDCLNFGAPIKQLDFSAVNKLGTATKTVEILHCFKLPDLILGIVPYDKYILVVVEPVSEDPTDESKQQPLVMILELDSTTQDGYTEVSHEEITLKDYQTSKFRNIHLDKIPNENEFYIVSPKDLVCAREREIDDRIEWLIKNKLFEKALELYKENESKEKKYTYKFIVLAYFNYLMEIKEFNKAGELCKSILNDPESFEQCVDVFLKSGHIGILLSIIDFTENIKLNPSIYMSILMNQLETNLNSFLKLIKKWPPALYSVNTVIDLIHRISDSRQLVFPNQINNEKWTPQMKIKQTIILESLAILHEYNHEHEKSLEYYFLLKSNTVFSIITKRKMFEYAKEKLLKLFQQDKDRTLTMLMEYINDIPPDTIVKILSPTPIWLFNYLHTLFNNNMLASEPYHLKLIHLYAEFKSDNLLSFLKSSDKYDLNEAIELCESKMRNKEVIYLLGRVGKSKEALERIMNQDDSVFEAIEYCRERDDADLWELLREHSSDKENFIKAILENSGMDINVLKFIKRILKGIAIPGLRDSLVTLLVNNEKENSLVYTNQVGQWEDIFKMMKDRFQLSTMAIVCDFTKDNKCAVCCKSIVNCTEELILFPCSHFCHSGCITEDHSQCWCHLCCDTNSKFKSFLSN